MEIIFLQLNQWTKLLQLYYYKKIFLRLDPNAARSIFLQFQRENQNIDSKGFWGYPKICPFWAVLGVPDWLLLQCLRKLFHLRLGEHRLWHHLNLKKFHDIKNSVKFENSKMKNSIKFHEILKFIKNMKIPRWKILWNSMKLWKSSKIWKFHDDNFYKIH